ncbi:MAG: Fic family protein [Patescibacteria group bacterium]|jgi:Fic family protein
MNNNHLDKRLRVIPNTIWSKIAKIDELKGQWVAGAQLSPQILMRLKKSILITSTGASTRIEGAKLSDEDIEKMMQGLSIRKFTDRDTGEVQGYYELLKNVFDSWQNISFSENTIKHFHKELLKFVNKDERHRGEYKKLDNKVVMIDDIGQATGVLFETTPPYLTAKEMHELVEWTKDAFKKQTDHPLIIIGNFLVEFLKIHPFLDGNGRLSRILTNLLLLQQNYAYVPYISHEKLIEDNKSDYYLALRRSQKTFKTDHEDIIPWLDFFLSIVLEQSKMAIRLLSKEFVDKLLSPIQLSVWQYLQTIKEATPNEISKNVGVARPTVNQVLNKLLQLKKIERIGLGRGTRYRKI